MGEEVSYNINGSHFINPLNQIGKGKYGSTFTGSHAGKKTAVKRLYYKSRKELPDAQDLLSGNIHHKNLLKYLNYSVKDEYHYFVMEFCDKGDLTHYIASHKTLIHKAWIMKELATAVDALHSLNPPIIHRNIKPENVLVKAENGNDVIKISDYGLASLLEDHLASSGGPDQSSYTDEGLYLPPESQDPECNWNNPSFDVFSLGLVFYAILQYDGSSTLKPYLIASQEEEERNENIFSIGLLMLEERKKNKKTLKLFDEYEKLYIYGSPKDETTKSNTDEKKILETPRYLSMIDCSKVKPASGLQDEENIQPCNEAENEQNQHGPKAEEIPDQNESAHSNTSTIQETRRCVSIFDYSKMEPGLVELQEIIKSMTVFEPEERNMLESLIWPLTNVHNKLEWLNSEISDPKQQIAMLFEEFAEDMGKNIPNVVQSCSKSPDLHRININIKKGNRKLVEELIRERCRPAIVRKGILHIEEQTSTEEDLACTDLNVSWHNGLLNKVQPGSPLLLLNSVVVRYLERWVELQQGQVTLGNVKSQILKLSREFEPQVPCKDSVGTLGCFLIDETHQIYAVTAYHVFNDTTANPKEILSVCSENGQDCRFIKLGSQKDGLYRLDQLNIALIPVNPDPNFKMYFEHEGREVKMEIEYLPSEDMKLRKVAKRGAISGDTEGFILEPDLRLNENGQLLTNAFRVCSLGPPVFASHGDSGSIVTDVLHQQPSENKKAIGILTKKVLGITIVNNNLLKDVFTCLPLNENKAAMERKKGLQLKMFEPSNTMAESFNHKKNMFVFFVFGVLVAIAMSLFLTYLRD